jgi:EAL domain-containing protein (putative c-di-GMP-specific phosphodiesterase class I)
MVGSTGDVPSQARQAWAERIRQALDEHRFELHAQATTDLSTGEVVLYEALVRLREPDGRLLPPRAFLAQAERAGLAVALDRAVVERAVAALAAAPDSPGVSINLSSASVAEPGFPAWVMATLDAGGVGPDRLVLEFAEHAAMNDTEHASAFASAARELGMGVALDDFGAGFASFTALKHVPLDFVKIDREYSAGARTVRADRVLVRGLVQMARGLGIRTIAQHVEDAETQEALRELGVDLAQGHELGRELPIGQALAPT